MKSKEEQIREVFGEEIYQLALESHCFYTEFSNHPVQLWDVRQEVGYFIHFNLEPALTVEKLSVRLTLDSIAADWIPDIFLHFKDISSPTEEELELLHLEHTLAKGVDLFKNTDNMGIF